MNSAAPIRISSSSPGPPATICRSPCAASRSTASCLDKRYGGKLDGQALEFLGYLRDRRHAYGSSGARSAHLHAGHQARWPRRNRRCQRSLAATLASLSGAIAESRATVTCGPLPSVRMHEHPPPAVISEPDRQCDQIPKTGLAPLVHVSAERQNGSWVFSVRDNGIGIEPEYKEQVFGLFKRLHTSDEYSGTGIGLAICQRIVERYTAESGSNPNPARDPISASPSPSEEARRRRTSSHSDRGGR